MRILLQRVFAWQRRRARELGVADPRPAAVSFLHLFGKFGRRAEALSFWDRILGDKPTSLAYEQWVEVVLSSRAHVRPKLRPRLQAEAARGLRRYPRHAGLRVLKAQLGR